MGNGSTKHGDAAADHVRDEFAQLDRELEVAIAQDETRAEMQSAHDLEEDSKLTAALLAKPAVVVVKDGSDSEKPPKSLAGTIRWGLGALGAGAIVALVGLLQQCGKH